MVDTCAVCYEDLAVIDTLSCGHKIHGTCIISSGKAICPICRDPLPDYSNMVTEVILEPTRWGTLDKLVSLGWLNHTDIPIIDDLKLPLGNDLLLVEAVLLLYIIKQII